MNQAWGEGAAASKPSEAHGSVGVVGDDGAAPDRPPLTEVNQDFNGVVEAARLVELARLWPGDRVGEVCFDGLVALASQVAGAPSAYLSVVDAQQQQFNARYNWDVHTMDRGSGLCDHVVRASVSLEVQDARCDPRFRAIAVVVGEPGVVFYAGFPLVSSRGLTIGTLAVIDYQVRQLNDGQRHGLQVLADQVMTQLELRDSAAAEARSGRRYRLLAEQARHIITEHRRDGSLSYVSPSVGDVLGYESESFVAENPVGYLHVNDLPLLKAAFRNVRRGQSQTLRARIRHADGSWRWIEAALAPVFDQTGTVVQVYSEARDVTAQIQETSEVTSDADFVRAVLDKVSVGIVACDTEGNVVFSNPAAREFNGNAAPAAGKISPEEWPRHFNLFTADGGKLLEPAQVPLSRALSEGLVENVEIIVAPHGLSARLLRCDGEAVRDASGRTIGAVVAMTDITATRKAENDLKDGQERLHLSNLALARSEAQFRNAFENGPLAMCQVNAEGVVTHANPAATKQFGRPDRPLFNISFVELSEASDRDRLIVALARASGVGTEPIYVEVRMVKADKSVIWCELAVSAGNDLDGSPHLLIQLADVDGRKRRETELHRQAALDDLTGLANRSALNSRLQKLVASEGEGALVSVLFLDLDGFKAVNDTGGHVAGDEVLVEVARRLGALVRPDDLVARLGGDEFVIVRTDQEAQVERGNAALIDSVQAALQAPYDTSTGLHRIGVSIGLVLAHRGDDPGELLARADAAMYKNKRRLTGRS